MLNWLWKRGSTGPEERDAPMHALTRPARRKAGKYHQLYEYLENRYASTVVLTFEQIEDLLGFALPYSARHDQDWWLLAGSGPDAGGSDAWTLASRTARANLRAHTVVFERVT